MKRNGRGLGPASTLPRSPEEGPASSLMTPQGNPSGHQPCRIEQGRLHFYGTSHPIHSELLQRLLSLLFTGVVGEGDGNVRWDGKRREIPHSELMKLWDSRDDPGAREARKRDRKSTRLNSSH